MSTSTTLVYVRVQSLRTSVHQDIHATATRRRNDAVLISQVDSNNTHNDNGDASMCVYGSELATFGLVYAPIMMID